MRWDLVSLFEIPLHGRVFDLSSAPFSICLLNSPHSVLFSHFLFIPCSPLSSCIFMVTFVLYLRIYFISSTVHWSESLLTVSTYSSILIWPLPTYFLVTYNPTCVVFGWRAFFLNEQGFPWPSSHWYSSSLTQHCVPYYRY